MSNSIVSESFMYQNQHVYNKSRMNFIPAFFLQLPKLNKVILKQIKFHLEEFLIHFLLNWDSSAWTNSAVLGASFTARVAASLFGWFGRTVLHVCLTIVWVSEALFLRIFACHHCPVWVLLGSFYWLHPPILGPLTISFPFQTWPLKSSKSTLNKWTLWSNAARRILTIKTS